MPAALRAAPQPTFPAHNPQPTALTLSSLVCPTCIRKSHRQHRAGFALQSHKGPRLAVANYSFAACCLLKELGAGCGQPTKTQGMDNKQSIRESFLPGRWPCCKHPGRQGLAPIPGLPIMFPSQVSQMGKDLFTFHHYSFFFFLGPWLRSPRCKAQCENHDPSCTTQKAKNDLALLMVVKKQMDGMDAPLLFELISRVWLPEREA